jgi:hypothetical protein
LIDNKIKYYLIKLNDNDDRIIIQIYSKNRNFKLVLLLNYEYDIRDDWMYEN